MILGVCGGGDLRYLRPDCVCMLIKGKFSNIIAFILLLFLPKTFIFSFAIESVCISARGYQVMEYKADMYIFHSGLIGHTVINCPGIVEVRALKTCSDLKVLKSNHQ